MLLSSRCKFYLTSLLVLLFLFPFISQAESIVAFDADMYVASDSSITVREKIEYSFDEPRHGIFRVIPTDHGMKDDTFYQERYLEIDVTSVLKDGESVPYTIDTSADEISIKIGDPDTTIEGTSVYEIVYTVVGGLFYFDSGAVDLYWNVTGNDWLTPIEKVTARVWSDESLFLDKNTCYQGIAGQTIECAEVVSSPKEITFSSSNLAAGEGLTIAQSISREYVERVELVRYKWELILLPFLLLGLVYAFWRLYKFEVRHKTGRTIIAEYEPYPGVKPMYSGLLFDGRLDSRDITAAIIYLAEQGFLKIKKTEKKVLFLFEVDDYELTLVKDLDESISTFEQKILTLLFGEQIQVGQVVSLTDLKKNVVKQAENRIILTELSQALSEDMVKQGFFEKGSTYMPSVVWQILIVIVLTILIAYFLGPVVILFIIAVVIIGIVGYERRTRKGYEVLDHLKGFKLFLEVTDKERFDFHNAPEKSPELFMVYLPYAIAFGVEEKWAKAFEGIVIQNPGWYDGGSVGAFSAANFATSVNAFSTALASSSTTSASSGGGSSGGGGGGGGGGSW